MKEENDHLIIHIKCPPAVKGGEYYTGCIGWTGIPYSEDDLRSQLTKINDSFANLQVVKIERYKDKEEYADAKKKRNAEYDRQVKAAEAHNALKGKEAGDA